MAEDDKYIVKAYKKPKEIEEIADEKIDEGPNLSQQELSQTEQIPKTTSPQPKKGFQIPQIPTQKIFKTLTDKEMMMQTLHDETMEPHVHLTILLILVFILAIIIGLLGI